MSRSARRRSPARKLRVVALEDRLAPATLHWVGDVDAFWGTNVGGNTNWDSNTLPGAGDTLVFNTSTLSNNNLSSLSLGGLEFGNSHHIVGNSLTLTGMIKVLGGGGTI